MTVTPVELIPCAAFVLHLWLTRRSRQKMGEAFRAAMRERRDYARHTVERLDYFRPFFEDLARLDPAREESMTIALLELERIRAYELNIAEGDTVIRRWVGDKP